jgi:hypothetical protein
MNTPLPKAGNPHASHSRVQLIWVNSVPVPHYGTAHFLRASSSPRGDTYTLSIIVTYADDRPFTPDDQISLKKGFPTLNKPANVELATVSGSTTDLSWLWLVLGIAVILVLLTAVALILRARNRRQDVDFDQDFRRPDTDFMEPVQPPPRRPGHDGSGG